MKGRHLSQIIVFSSFVCAEDLPREMLFSLFQTQTMTYKTSNVSAFTRLGELRKGTLNNNLWVADAFGVGRLEAYNSFQTNQTSYNQVMMGYDTYAPIGDSRLYFGGMFDVYLANGAILQNRGDTQAYGLSAYVSYHQGNRFYLDGIARLYYSFTQYNLTQAPLNFNDIELGSTNFYLALEAGQKFELVYGLDESFMFIEPSLQLQSGYLSSLDALVSSMEAQAYGYVPFGLNASIAVGKEFDGKGCFGGVRGGLVLGYDYQNGGKIEIPGLVSKSKMHDVRLGVFVESDFTLNDYLRFYAHYHSSFWGQFNEPYAIALGMRVSFGRTNTHRLNVGSDLDWNSQDRQ
ncbi:hypothetical protein BBW65_01235 [Helicobacter enhydrae]|uniref:Autotransporter domain-containing protein n=1 Tax=Helicobacter enhydrae TaxID=222136 RepID=A0A1B1U401_9HELI|nr:autotransporter outer membrane beta-barrel domain-containing protein [Helicobacter enhydrae]ANV97514.1 hypothetical protein BBW65_01235 [Helicobacter enhydrae]